MSTPPPATIIFPIILTNLLNKPAVIFIRSAESDFYFDAACTPTQTLNDSFYEVPDQYDTSHPINRVPFLSARPPENDKYHLTTKTFAFPNVLVNQSVTFYAKTKTSSLDPDSSYTGKACVCWIIPYPATPSSGSSILDPAVGKGPEEGMTIAEFTVSKANNPEEHHVAFMDISCVEGVSCGVEIKATSSSGESPVFIDSNPSDPVAAGWSAGSTPTYKAIKVNFKGGYNYIKSDKWVEDDGTPQPNIGLPAFPGNTLTNKELAEAGSATNNIKMVRNQNLSRRFMARQTVPNYSSWLRTTTNGSSYTWAFEEWIMYDIHSGWLGTNPNPYQSNRPISLTNNDPNMEKYQGVELGRSNVYAAGVAPAFIAFESRESIPDPDTSGSDPGLVWWERKPVTIRGLSSSFDYDNQYTLLFVATNQWPFVTTYRVHVDGGVSLFKLPDIVETNVAETKTLMTTDEISIGSANGLFFASAKYTSTGGGSSSKHSIIVRSAISSDVTSGTSNYGDTLRPRVLSGHTDTNNHYKIASNFDFDGSNPIVYQFGTDKIIRFTPNVGTPYTTTLLDSVKHEYTLSSPFITSGGGGMLPSFIATSRCGDANSPVIAAAYNSSTAAPSIVAVFDTLNTNNIGTTNILPSVITPPLNIGDTITALAVSDRMSFGSRVVSIVFAGTRAPPPGGSSGTVGAPFVYSWRSGMTNFDSYNDLSLIVAAGITAPTSIAFHPNSKKPFVSGASDNRRAWFVVGFTANPHIWVFYESAEPASASISTKAPPFTTDVGQPIGNDNFVIPPPPLGVAQVLEFSVSGSLLFVGITEYPFVWIYSCPTVDFDYNSSTDTTKQHQIVRLTRVVPEPAPCDGASDYTKSTSALRDIAEPSTIDIKFKNLEWLNGASTPPQPATVYPLTFGIKNGVATPLNIPFSIDLSSSSLQTPVINIFETLFNDPYASNPDLRASVVSVTIQDNAAASPFSLGNQDPTYFNQIALIPGVATTAPFLHINREGDVYFSATDTTIPRNFSDPPSTITVSVQGGVPSTPHSLSLQVEVTGVAATFALKNPNYDSYGVISYVGAGDTNVQNIISLLFKSTSTAVVNTVQTTAAAGQSVVTTPVNAVGSTLIDISSPTFPVLNIQSNGDFYFSVSLGAGTHNFSDEFPIIKINVSDGTTTIPVYLKFLILPNNTPPVSTLSLKSQSNDSLNFSGRPGTTTTTSNILDLIDDAYASIPGMSAVVISLQINSLSYTSINFTTDNDYQSFALVDPPNSGLPTLHINKNGDAYFNIPSNSPPISNTQYTITVSVSRPNGISIPGESAVDISLIFAVTADTSPVVIQPLPIQDYLTINRQYTTPPTSGGVVASGTSLLYFDSLLTNSTPVTTPTLFIDKFWKISTPTIPTVTPGSGTTTNAGSPLLFATTVANPTPPLQPSSITINANGSVTYFQAQTADTLVSGAGVGVTNHFGFSATTNTGSGIGFGVVSFTAYLATITRLPSLQTLYVFQSGEATSREYPGLLLNGIIVAPPPTTASQLLVKRFVLVAQNSDGVTFPNATTSLNGSGAINTNTSDTTTAYTSLPSRVFITVNQQGIVRIRADYTAIPYTARLWYTVSQNSQTVPSPLTASNMFIDFRVTVPPRQFTMTTTSFTENVTAVAAPSSTSTSPSPPPSTAVVTRDVFVSGGVVYSGLPSTINPSLSSVTFSGQPTPITFGGSTTSVTRTFGSNGTITINSNGTYTFTAGVSPTSSGSPIVITAVAVYSDGVIAGGPGTTPIPLTITITVNPRVSVLLLNPIKIINYFEGYSHVVLGNVDNTLANLDEDNLLYGAQYTTPINSTTLSVISVTRISSTTTTGGGSGSSYSYTTPIVANPPNNLTVIPNISAGAFSVSSNGGYTFMSAAVSQTQPPPTTEETYYYTVRLISGTTVETASATIQFVKETLPPAKDVALVPRPTLAIDSGESKTVNASNGFLQDATYISDGTPINSSSAGDEVVVVASIQIDDDASVYSANASIVIVGAGTLVVSKDGSYTFSAFSHINSRTIVVRVKVKSETIPPIINTVTDGILNIDINGGIHTPIVPTINPRLRPVRPPFDSQRDVEPVWSTRTRIAAGIIIVILLVSIFSALWSSAYGVGGAYNSSGIVSKLVVKLLNSLKSPNTTSSFTTTINKPPLL